MRADGVIFGVCSEDVIKSLSTSTCERDQTDRMDNLFRHVLGQRRSCRSSKVGIL